MDIGEALRTAREQRGLSLETISERTKIGVAALRAIEGNDVQRLPGGIFLRGFVRAYAREVGLDVEDTVNRYVAQFESQPVVGEGAAGNAVTLDSSIENGETRSLEGSLREASALGLVAIIVLSVGLLAYMTLRQTLATSGTSIVRALTTPEAPAPPIPADPDPATPADPAAATPADPAAATPADPASATPAGPAPVAPAAPAARAAPAPVTTVATAQALSQTAPVSTPRETGTAGSNNEPAEFPATPVQSGNALKLTIETTGPCWVTATVDGETVLYRLMQEGERESIPDGNDVVLRVGDPGTFTFSVNGAPGKSLGEAGTAATVHITPDNYRDFIGATPAP